MKQPPAPLAHPPPAWARRARRCPARRGADGFSLLEVLVAITVLALGLGVLYQALGTGARAAGSGDRYSRAVLHARSVLAGAGTEIPLAEGETSGRLADERGYRWRLQVTPYVDAAGEPVTDGAVEVFSVVAEVSWGEGERERGVRLATVRLGPR